MAIAQSPNRARAEGRPHVRAKAAFLALALLFVATPAASDDYSFVTLKLPHGIQIDTPRMWRALDDDQNKLIALAHDAALDLSATAVRYTGNVLFAANSTPANTYASIRVTFEPAMPSSAQEIAELRNMDEHDLAELEPAYLAQMNQNLAPQGLKVVTNFGLSKETYGAYPALSYRYRRNSPNGPVIVDLVQIWRPDAMVRINLAYREAEGQIWRVVIDRIKKSIAID
jgi:hypothetical protein